jgi:integrase
MGSAISPGDATLISVLAYAGLRRGEALALRRRDIREQTVLVERAMAKFVSGRQHRGEHR